MSIKRIKSLHSEAIKQEGDRCMFYIIHRKFLLLVFSCEVEIKELNFSFSWVRSPNIIC